MVVIHKWWIFTYFLHLIVFLITSFQQACYSFLVTLRCVDITGNWRTPWQAMCVSGDCIFQIVKYDCTLIRVSSYYLKVNVDVWNVLKDDFHQQNGWLRLIGRWSRCWCKVDVLLKYSGCFAYMSVGKHLPAVGM